MCYLVIPKHHFMTKYTINKALYIAGILVMFSSCITIRINQNDYKDLTAKQLSEVKQFSDDYDASEKGFVTEITAKDIYPSFKENEYTWVHFWVPYCKSDNCKPLWFYDNISTKQKSNGVKLFLTSITYDYRIIKSQITKFSDRVYVLKDSVYGHKVGKNQTRFIEEIVADGYMNEPTRHSDLIFKGDSLVFYGNMITSAKIDSVIKATQ